MFQILKIIIIILYLFLFDWPRGPNFGPTWPRKAAQLPAQAARPTQAQVCCFTQRHLAAQACCSLPPDPASFPCGPRGLPGQLLLPSPRGLPGQLLLHPARAWPHPSCLPHSPVSCFLLSRQWSARSAADFLLLLARPRPSWPAVSHFHCPREPITSQLLLLSRVKQ